MKLQLQFFGGRGSAGGNKVTANEVRAVSTLMRAKTHKDGEVLPPYMREYSDEAIVQYLNKAQPKRGYEWGIEHRVQDTIYGEVEQRYLKRRKESNT